MIVKATAESPETPEKTVLSPVANPRVLHVINGQHFSGAERVQDLLALSLPKFGFDVDFACLKADKFPKVRQSKSPLFEVSMRSSYDIFCYRQIVQLAKSNGYVAIHAHTPRSLMIAAVAAKRLCLPLVYHVHSPVGLDSTRSLQNRINSWVESFSLRAVSRMICVSGSLAQYMAGQGHDPKKICVVHNGVPSVGDLADRRPPDDCWTIGAMALFRPRKGTEVLLEALAILKKEKINLKLRAVGPFESAEYEAAIHSHVKRLDIQEMILWTGFQNDINTQLQQMDLFVLPSLFGEGLPMVVLEAMAQGVPVIASRVEGIPEAIRDGVDGFVFEPASAEDLARRIMAIHGDTNRWQQMRESSFLRQQDKFSETSMARGVADVYHSLS